MADVHTARERLLKVEKTLNTIVIGHEDYVRALMLGLVAGEHVWWCTPIIGATA